MNHRLLNLLVMIAVALLMLGFTLTGSGSPPIRALLSLLLVLVMPGYALTLAFFPGDKLELAERVAFSLGMSLALTALGGLVLNLLPWGLTPTTWGVLLSSLTLIASLIALLGWQKTPALPRRPAFNPVHLRLSFDQALLFGLAGLVAAGAFMVAYYGEVSQDRPAYTQLWLLPTDDGAMSLGVRNYEQDAVTYRLEVDADGVFIMDNTTIQLDPGETWTLTLTLPATPAQAKTIRARLFRYYVPADVCTGDAPPADCQRNQEVYRQVVL